MKTQRYITLVFLLFSSVFPKTFAQCAMCRASLENSMSNGDGLLRGINYGIIYLASAPYLIIVFVVYFWYKTSKKNYAQRIKTSSHHPM
jgi:hypothetical protein